MEPACDEPGVEGPRDCICGDLADGASSSDPALVALGNARGDGGPCPEDQAQPSFPATWPPGGNDSDCDTCGGTAIDPTDLEVDPCDASTIDPALVVLGNWPGIGRGDAAPCPEARGQPSFPVAKPPGGTDSDCETGPGTTIDPADLDVAASDLVVGAGDASTNDPALVVLGNVLCSERGDAALDHECRGQPSFPVP